MVWWKIVLLGIAAIIGGAVLDFIIVWIIAAIIERRMERKYPDWKHRGGRRS